MLEIVECLLCGSTGLMEPASSYTIKLITEIVTAELEAILLDATHIKRNSDPATGFTDPIPVENIIHILSHNTESLHRLVRRFIVSDSIRKHAERVADDAINQVSKQKNPQTVKLRRTLEICGWSSDQIDPFLALPDGMVKVARNSRMDLVTAKMNKETYSNFCDQRRVSFLGSNGGLQKSMEVFLLSLNLNPVDLSSLLKELVGYIAAEIVYVIVDLVLLVRYDFRYGTFLRYWVLAGLDETGRLKVADAIASVVESPITSEEIRNICRIFCCNELGKCEKCDLKRKPLILYL